jgi:hypothetical protein
VRHIFCSIQVFLGAKRSSNEAKTWLMDAKVFHDWGNNIIAILGIGM